MTGLDGREGLAEAFDEAAPRYDLLTGLNPGYHRHLDTAARRLVENLADSPGVLIDLGCGSGASTAALLRHAPSATMIGVDASSGMLAQARSKRWPPGVEFHHAKAQELAGLDLPPADGVMAAYLLRNLDEAARNDFLASVYDQLRPGGWLAILDYSVAGRRWAGFVWTLVCWLVVIPLSWLVGGAPRLYAYLWRSVRDFDTTDVVADRLRRAGFADPTHYDVTGWQHGILHIVLAQRPHRPIAPR